jgi:hypothetical protein
MKGGGLVLQDSEGGAHQAAVDTWLKGAEGQSTKAILDLFEEGLHRIVRYAQPTLGEITLGTIVDRVLYTASERHPFLSPLEASGGTVKLDGLRNALGDVEASELTTAARFALVEFLTVLGTLTAQILTPALHAELSHVPDADGCRTSPKRKTET